MPRRLTIDSVAGPCIVLAAVNAWVLWKEHWEHWDHSPPPSERPQYSYMNIRTRKYPWGDGNKVSQDPSCSLKSSVESIANSMLQTLL